MTKRTRRKIDAALKAEPFERSPTSLARRGRREGIFHFALRRTGRQFARCRGIPGPCAYKVNSVRRLLCTVAI